MADPIRNKDQFATASYSSTDTIELVTINASFLRYRGIDVLIFSTQRGTVELFYIDPWGNERSLHDSQVNANILKLVDIDARIPVVKITFTPTTATPGTVWVEAMHY